MNKVGCAFGRCDSHFKEFIDFSREERGDAGEACWHLIKMVFTNWGMWTYGGFTQRETNSSSYLKALLLKRRC